MNINFLKIIGLTAIVFNFCNCDDKDPLKPSFINYDTAFQIDQLQFPNTSFINSATGSTGNTYRLLQFFNKAEKGDLLKIGFIGGSITEGSHAGSNENRYTTQFCRLLEKTFPESDFIEVNAGIGGTTSRYACSRVQSDLLKEKPDLIVIDFSVNDYVWDSLMTVKTFEGLLRQCLQREDIPVLIIHFTVENGNSTNQRRYSTLANHYKLPVINYQNAVMEYIASGKLKWASIASDAIHPNTQGHFLAAYMLHRFISDTMVIKDKNNGVKNQIPAPLYSDLYETADIYSLLNKGKIRLISNTGWDTNKDNRSRYGYSSQIAGNTITFEVNFREFSICYLRNNITHSNIEIQLNGQVTDTLIGKSYYPYIYMEMYQVFEQTVQKTMTITFRNLEDNKFEIPYLLFVE